MKRCWILLGALLTHPLSAEIESDDCKQVIAMQSARVAEAAPAEKGELLKQLAVYYLKDQDQEHAFESFLTSLEFVAPQSLPTEGIEEDTDLYDKALAVYLEPNSQTPQEMARKIIKEYAASLEGHPQSFRLAYLLALAYANLQQYERFFDLFLLSYRYYPEHFLAYKTKAILHLKLMERKPQEKDREKERLAIVSNLEKALSKEPRDTALYKLLILFATPEIKAQYVRQCLNKIVEDNIIIPRNDIMFFVEAASETKEIALAQRFLAKARQWYQNSRLIVAAQDYLDRQK